MINFNPTAGSIAPQPLQPAGVIQKPDELKKTDFGNLIKKYVAQADQQQQQSDAAAKDLLTGKNEDINSIVAQVAKADMSFKLLVGVRNKIIEAYKQTMQMQI